MEMAAELAAARRMPAQGKHCKELGCLGLVMLCRRHVEDGAPLCGKRPRRYPHGVWFLGRLSAGAEGERGFHAHLVLPDHCKFERSVEIAVHADEDAAAAVQAVKVELFPFERVFQSFYTEAPGDLY